MTDRVYNRQRSTEKNWQRMHVMRGAGMCWGWVSVGGAVGGSGRRWSAFATPLPPNHCLYVRKRFNRFRKLSTKTDFLLNDNKYFEKHLQSFFGFENGFRFFRNDSELFEHVKTKFIENCFLKQNHSILLCWNRFSIIFCFSVAPEEESEEESEEVN